MIRMLLGRTNGWDLAPEERKCPSSTVYRYILSSCSRGGENLVQSQPKNQPFPVPTNFFLPSSSPYRVFSSWNPIYTFLLHQQMVVQPPYEPKSSPVAEQPPQPSSLSPLQLFFFRHHQPPSATIPSTKAYWAIGQTSSSQLSFHRRSTSFPFPFFFFFLFFDVYWVNSRHEL